MSMKSTYSSLPSPADNTSLAKLGVQAFSAGVALSPVVAYLALKILENLESAKSMVGNKSLLDRITKRRGRKSKKKSAKDRRADKKKKTDDKLKKLDTRNVEYIKSEVESVLEANYKPRIITALEDNNNSLGNQSWTDTLYKDFVKDEVKAINREKNKVGVDAWRKPKKKGDKKVRVRAQMLPIKVSIDVKKFPWKIKIYTRKTSASITFWPSTTKVKALKYDSFSGTGIPYELSKITHGDKTNKRRKINSWLIDQDYQWTHGVDSAGNEVRTPEMEFLRMKDGKNKPGFLRKENGFLIQGIDPDAYKHFLGKTLSGANARRANTRTMNRLLPPGYYAKKKGSDIIISGKSGSGTTTVLNWDSGLLAVGNSKRVPKVVNTKKFDASTDATYESLNSTQIDTMVDNMFKKDTTGAVTTPEKVDGDFKTQKKPSRKHWKDYIAKKSALQQRPKTIDTNLGYTVNVNRKSLSSMHLPELRKNDDKGHLVAARFSGANNANHLDVLDNLVPMDKTVNQKGKWQVLERSMAQVYIGSAAKPGDYVNVKMTLDYGNYIRRPDSIAVVWKHMRSSSAIKTKSVTVNNP